MPKRNDAQIFVLCHKKVDYDIPNNSLYTPLQVGSALTDEDVCELKDNTLINISNKNKYYLETTGTYWIWKNMCKKYKYIGQCQYRRQLIFDENTNFDEIFKEYDAIIAEPLKFKISLFIQYSISHNLDDLKIIESILKKDYPEYTNDIEKLYSSNVLYYSAGIILKQEDFNKYCTFLFDILEKYLKIIHVNNYNDVAKYVKTNTMKGKYKRKVLIDYQTRLCGYIAERLMTLYVNHNFKNIMTIKYKLMENTNV